jgi:hypothetical protein
MDGTLGASAADMARLLARLGRYGPAQYRAVVRLLLDAGVETPAAAGLPALPKPGVGGAGEPGATDVPAHDAPSTPPAEIKPPPEPPKPPAVDEPAVDDAASDAQDAPAEDAKPKTAKPKAAKPTTAKPTTAKPKSAKPKPAPKVKQSRRVLDPKARLGAEAAKKQLEGHIGAESAAVLGTQETIRALEARLKELAASPQPRPPELAQDIADLPGIDDAEARVEKIEELEQKPGLSAAATKYLGWLKEVATVRGELEDIKAGNLKAGEALQTAQDVALPRAAAALRKASKVIAELLRRKGPNYIKLDGVNFDQIVGEKRWLDKWSGVAGRPPFHNDHLVALDRIANLPDLTDFLLAYEKAAPAVKESMTDALVALGDDQANLVRMRSDANLMKSNRSWDDISYEDAKKFDYEKSDVDAMRTREHESLARILKAIRELTEKYK